MRWNQYIVSNNIYYSGKNRHDWTSTASMYDVIKNVNQMEIQANTALGTSTHAYAALAKFFQAYVYVWQTQRVGDTPAVRAGAGLAELKTAFDAQKAVYVQSLALLDSANTMLGSLICTSGNAATGETFRCLKSSSMSSTFRPASNSLRG